MEKVSKMLENCFDKLVSGRSLKFVILICAALCVCTAQAAQTWDLAADYSVLNGLPNGVWSYGFKEASSLTADLTNCNSAAASFHTGYDAWFAGVNATQFGYNHDAAELFSEYWGFNYVFPPKSVVMMQNGSPMPACRFTAPADGDYTISATFYGVGYGTSLTVSEVFVTVNNTPGLFAGNVNGYAGGSTYPASGTNPTASYNGTVTLAEGDDVDFIAYSGALIVTGISVTVEVDNLKAYNPDPADETELTTDTGTIEPTLTWSPGDLATSQDIYFGTDIDAVTNATIADPQGVYKGTISTDPNIAASLYEPGEIGIDETCYWRIDSTDGTTVWKGDVWMFTVVGLKSAWDAADDFSATVNPNDAWSYGVIGGPNGAGFAVHPGAASFAGFNYWWTNTPGQDNTARGFIIHNPGETDINATGIWGANDVLKVNQFALSSSAYDIPDKHTLRWTAPIAGTYDISVTLSGITYSGVGTVSPVNIAVNGVSVFTDTINGFEGSTTFSIAAFGSKPTTSYSGTHVLAAGDTIDIIKDNTATTSGCNAVAVDAVITTQLLIASDPDPAHGETIPGSFESITLSWMPGAQVAATDGHQVYFGTTFIDVKNATVSEGLGVYQGAQTAAEFDAGVLDLDETYYWRVDETDGTTTWKGQVWELNTNTYVNIDNFESYADNAALQAVWSANASLNDEKTLDDFSMTVSGNTSVTRTLAGSNWTGLDIAAIGIRFYGPESNSESADEMAVTLSDGTNSFTVYYDGDAQDISLPEFAGFYSWNIATSDFTGLDFSNITSITLTLGGNAGDVVYFDNIRVYVPRCVGSKIAPDFDGDCIVDDLDLAILIADWLKSDETVTAAAASDTGLITYFNFNETSGFVAANAADPNGFATMNDSAAHWDANGYAGGCINFNNTFVAVIPAAADTFASLTDEITVSWWINGNVSDPGDDNDVFFAGLGTPTNILVAIRGLSANIGFMVDETTNNNKSIGTPTLYANEYKGVWNHYAFVKNAADQTMRIYRNGEVVVQVDDALNAFANITSFAIGGGPAGTNMYNGKIDEFRIYNRALSQAEILSLAGQTSVFQELDSDADADEDGTVDMADFASMASGWLQELVWPSL